MVYYKVLEDTSLQGCCRIQGLQTKQHYLFKKEEEAAINEVSNILVEGEKDAVYPDVMQSPILILSEPMRKLIQLFDETISFKIAILTDLALKQQKVYYIPFLEQIEGLSERTTYLKNGVEDRMVLKKEAVRDQHLFYIKGARMCYLCVSRSLAESMLRRGFTGFKLERMEVER